MSFVLKTTSPKSRFIIKLKIPIEIKNKKPVINPALANEKGIPKIPTPTIVPTSMETEYKKFFLASKDKNVYGNYSQPNQRDQSYKNAFFSQLGSPPEINTQNKTDERRQNRRNDADNHQRF
mgnify:CR=1 FL=1